MCFFFLPKGTILRPRVNKAGIMLLSTNLIADPLFSDNSYYSFMIQGILYLSKRYSPKISYTNYVSRFTCVKVLLIF